MGRQRHESGRSGTRTDRTARAGASLRELATLRTDLDLFESVDDLQWKGPTPAFSELAAHLDKAARNTSEGTR